MLQVVLANRGKDDEEILEVLDGAIEKIIKINSR